MKQRGYSMLEVMIGLAIMGTIFVGALTLADQARDQTSGRSKADLLVSFQQLAAQYFLANRAGIEAAMAGDATAALDHCLTDAAVAPGGWVGVNTVNTVKRTCAFDATLLVAKGLWPLNLPINVQGGGRYVAIIRQIMSTEPIPQPTGADEMLVVLAPLNDGLVQTSGSAPFNGNVARVMEEIGAGMAAMGGSGGYVPPGTDYANCQYHDIDAHHLDSTNQACGANWSVSLSNFDAI